MHISDGVLPTYVAVGSYAVSLALATWSARRINPEEFPKIAVVTSAFFVASLIHVPLGPTSVHLILSGLVGIMLGSSAFVSVALGIVLQSLLFQFGGITAIGANSLLAGIPAVTAGWLFHALKGRSLNRHVFAGALAGGWGVFLAVGLLALLLISGGEDFFGVALIALYAHIPVLAIESAVCAFTVSFLYKVKPQLLGMSSASRPGE